MHLTPPSSAHSVRAARPAARAGSHRLHAPHGGRDGQCVLRFALSYLAVRIVVVSCKLVYQPQRSSARDSVNAKKLALDHRVSSLRRQRSAAVSCAESCAQVERQGNGRSRLTAGGGARGPALDPCSLVQIELLTPLWTSGERNATAARRSNPVRIEYGNMLYVRTPPSQPFAFRGFPAACISRARDGALVICV